MEQMGSRRRQIAAWYARKWQWRRTGVILLWAAAVAFSIALVVGGIHLARQQKSTLTDWMSWFQAVGSIGAIFSVLWIARADDRREQRSRRLRARLAIVPLPRWFRSMQLSLGQVRIAINLETEMSGEPFKNAFDFFEQAGPFDVEILSIVISSDSELGEILLGLYEKHIDLQAKLKHYAGTAPAMRGEVASPRRVEIEKLSEAYRLSIADWLPYIERVQELWTGGALNISRRNV
ncbi:hypothetical protein NWF24_17715 [Variovorax paradoxus]|uniref:hypothetical protein n=1 Tax=Variovorax paradoxus TaxID=34073 RepID=UPI0021ABD1DA|nr:hypothetical protein [Variovorax paradoxus]UVH54684.1 hypothetical protein NWF24_17715 [Variovorax paradoxus]